MKNKSAIVAALLVILLAILTGCVNNDLDGYKKAADRTDGITKGQNSAEFSVTLDFNTEGLPQEKVDELNYYKDISGSFQSAFDSTKDQGVYRSYMNLGGLGFDFDVYQNGKEMFIKLPVIGKYMRMDDLIREAQEKDVDQSQFISDDTLKALSGEWVGMLKEEDVFKGKDMVLTTPDGEVKTKIYTITLNDSQVKTFEEKAVEILSQDENLRSNIETLIKKKADWSKYKDFDELVAKMKEQIRRDTVESFQYTAYVDIDGYIVNETIDVRIKRDALKSGEPKAIHFHLDMKNWDINQGQKLEFPVLTEDNTIQSEHLDETMPSLFTDLFRTH